MRIKSWGQSNKSFLDLIIEKFRLHIVLKEIGTGKVLDLGCGYSAKLLKTIEPKIDLGIGVDISVNKNIETSKIKLIKSRVDKKLAFKTNYFDQIVSLAVIEHVNNPQIVFSEAKRMLKAGGALL